MTKGYFALAVFALVSWAPAYGQYASVVQMCAHDVSKYCSTDKQFKAATFADCIKAHFNSFSGVCKTALVRIAAVTNSCTDDIAKQCPSVRPGSGKILLCAKRHYPALSEECKAAVGLVAASQLQSR